MLDEDLAVLYGVETRILIRAVKRNAGRFPEDFMISLSFKEVAALRSQFGISKGRGGRRTLPYAFTEHGVLMLSSVLNSERALQVNIEITRAFIHWREMLISHEDLARKLMTLEKKYDETFRIVFDSIRKLMEPPPGKPKKRIGF